MIHELTLAARSLLRAPLYTGMTVMVMLLAVGANATVLSLLNGLVLRQLPVPEPDTLVQITTRDRLGREADLTWGQFQQFLTTQRLFSSVIGSIAQGVFTIETERGVQRSAVTGVTGNYFAELGATPALGRLLNPTDVSLSSVTAEPVVVIGWSFWQRHYEADPLVIGRTLKVEGTPLTVVGVAPKGFLGLGLTIEHDVTIPLTLVPTISEAEAAMVHGTARWVATTGRLSSGVSLAEAEAYVATIWPGLREAALPPALAGPSRQAYLSTQAEVRSAARGLERGLRGRYTKALYALLAIAGVVLVVAAVNLCSITFARIESRRQELAVRLSLGASRMRVTREIAAEGILLGEAGAAGGLLFAQIVSPVVAGFLLQDYLVPTSLDVRPDVLVLLAIVVTSVAVGVAITGAAAWVVSSPMVDAISLFSARSVSRSRRIGRALVCAQVAASLVLIATAALLARNVHAIAAADSGLTTESIMVGYPFARVGAYRTLEPTSYYRQALELVEALPGGAAAAFSGFKPHGGALPLDVVAPAASPANGGEMTAEIARVSPGFFNTVGLAIVQGRDFTFADQPSSRRVAIVSQRVARQLFGDGEGLGQRIRLSIHPEWQDTVIVGIVADAVVHDVRGGNVALVYTPALQASGR